MDMPAAKTVDHRHMVQLDALRAFAAFAVIVQHFSPFESYTRFPIGMCSVWLFFVLSGFLITGILLGVKDRAAGDRSAKAYAWRAFYGRRVLRIFPLYYFVVIAAALMNLYEVRNHVGWYLGHLGNVAYAMPGQMATPLVHYWSLSVEEQFYLIWPALVLLAPRRWILRTSIGMVILAPVIRVLMRSAGFRWEATMALPPACLDGLGMGALLALVRHGDHFSERQQALFRRVALGVGLAMVVADGLGRLSHDAFRFPFAFRCTSYGLVFYWLIDRASKGFQGVAGRILEAKPLVYLGRISYGIYVFHMPVPFLYQWIQVHLGVDLGCPSEHGWKQLAYVTLTSIALATISWFAMEKPINDLKRFVPYFRPTRRAADLAKPPASDRVADNLAHSTPQAIDSSLVPEA